MFWRCVALALVACEVPPPDPAPVVVTYEVAPAPSVWPLVPASGRIGRGVAAQPVTTRGIPGKEPLGAATIWPIDAPGAAMAIATRGTTVELLDVDGGKSEWRTTCDAPVVGASAAGIVCGDDRGISVLGLDGKIKWKHPGGFVALTGSRVVMSDGAVLDVVKGAEVERVTVPAGARVLATCEHALVVVLADHRLAKIVAGKQAWAVSSDPVVGIEGCAAGLLARVEGLHGAALVAIGETGKLLGRVDDVRGWWIARDDPQRLEIATATTLASWDRSLVESRVLDLPAYGPLLASRGERRLVRVSPHAAAVIDRKGVRAFVELPESTAALGDEAILAGGLRSFTLPRPWSGAAPRVFSSAPVQVAAELRDLPAAIPIDPTGATLPSPDREIATIALAGSVVVVGTEQAVAHLDLSPVHWGWRIPTKPIVALAASDGIAVYASATDVVALDLETGAQRWAVTFPAEAVEVVGGVVLARGRGRTIVIDRAGRALGELATDRATLLPGLVIAVEHGRIVARLPDVRMVPVWSVAVAGVVAGIQRAGAGVIVALDDGDAYQLDAMTGAATALPAIGLTWRADEDLVAGEAPGGPIPPSPIVPPPAGKPEVYKPTDLEVAPAIATPWPPPPAMPASFQLTLVEPTGALRARDDYAVTGAITNAVRSAGAPLVYRAGRNALVIGPNGDPLRRASLPDELGPLFSTVIDGKPVVGTILAGPLRAVTF